MPLPSLTEADIQNIVSQATDIEAPLRGGQKLVFPCRIKEERYVLKTLLIDPPQDVQDPDDSQIYADEVFLRANREVEIMQQCNTPHIAKLGPIPLKQTVYGSEMIIYFSEEYFPISLKNQIASTDIISVEQIIRLARNITEAISCLWEHEHVHRDIKPGNIMQRSTTGEYVLLDMGMAYDLSGDSFTATGYFVGTPAYVSPERLDLSQKHSLEFRSDLFSLGIVLYEACTKSHPFRIKALMTNNEWFKSIQRTTPQPISNFRDNIPSALEDIIIRLLSKQAHQRYKSCRQLDRTLSEI